MNKQNTISSLQKRSIYNNVPILVAGTNIETGILKKLFNKELSFEEIAERKGYDEGTRQLEKALQKIQTIKEPVFKYCIHTADIWPNTKNQWEHNYFREHFLDELEAESPYSMIIASGNLRTYNEYSFAGGGMRTTDIVNELKKTAQHWATELYLIGPLDDPEKFNILYSRKRK